MKINHPQNLASENFAVLKAPLYAGPARCIGVQTKDGFEYQQPKLSAALSAQRTTPTSMGVICSLFNNKIINYRPLGGGENFVYLINDNWVFRIPKEDNAKSANRREQILLKELSKYVKSTQIPAYNFWDYEAGVGGYEEIKGIALSYKFYNNLMMREKSLLAHDLALAISEIHSLPIKNTPFLKISTPEAREYIKVAGSLLGPQGIFSQKHAKKIQQAIKVTQGLMSKPDSALVVVHSDLHCDNIIVNPKAKKLSGLIDFSDARIGFAAIDFANLYRVSPQLAEEAAGIYANTKNIDAHDFIAECRAWSTVWQAACISRNYYAKTLREQKRVIRAGRAINYLLELKQI